MLAEHVNEKSVFNIARRIDSREARAEYLEQVFGDNPESLGRVVALLQVHEHEQSFLEAPAVARVEIPAVETIERLAGERPGTQVGRYKLLEEIGEGGMGIVFVAEQTEPVRRRVALKIIKPGMDTKQVIARFEAERQALAMMDHPNIARVLDAGSTEAGRPYFVMELVRGMPITEYCDKARLAPRQRLELFVDICQAVQHAHQKGIIHRDLKPSNVLVTLHDGTPVVKVIDFGVAKAVGQQLTERTIYTALTQLVGTPLYMSPEQAEMSGLDVDTRSDVYSLGVLLYELLTGQTPFDKETLGKAGLDEMRRIIREDEPLRPSRRFSTLGAQAISTVSQHRSLDERRLSKILCGELDWIVMKALEKDRSRRYESASALAADIQRYLSDEPVLACPPTAMYRFQKFARKHKPALATAAAIAACLILGTTVSAWQAVRATTAEAQATANEAQAKEATAAEAQQRQRAEANEQKAVANAASAQEKEQEAVKQRDEVKALADKLAAKEQQLQQTLYNAHMNLAQRAWDSQNVVRVNELLDQHRPKPGETDLRGFEWHYLHKLCHPELFAFPRYYIVAYSPDGKRLAMSANDHVKVLDTQTNRELLSIKARDARLAFSPDSKRLAAAVLDEHAVKVWDTETGAELHTFKGDEPEFMPRVAFSPDGTRLANIGRLKAVTVRDLESGREIFSIPGEDAKPPGRFVGSMSFSPDGKRLATSGKGQLIVLDAQTGQELLALKGRMGNTVVYSPDGTCLGSASRDESLPLQGGGTAPNYRVRLWSAQSGEILLTFKGDPLFEMKLAFSPDGKRLAAALEGSRTVKVWDTQTGDELLTFVGHNNNVLSLEFDPTGRRLALAGGGGGVRVFDVDRMLKTPTFNTAGDSWENFDLSPDGTRLAGFKAESIKLWDAQTGQEIHSFQEPKANRPFTVTISPDGKRLAAGFGTNHETKKRHYVAGEVKVWDAHTGQEIVTFKGHTTSVVSLAFSPDSTRLASCGGLSTTPVLLKDQGPGEIKVWDVATGQETLTLPAQFVYSVAYSPDGKRLATLSLEKLNVWDANSGRELLSLPAKCSTKGCVTFSPDGKQLASTNERENYRPAHVKLFDSETGKELLTLQGHGSYVKRIAFSPDGRRIALGGGNSELKLWDTQTGEELLAFDNIGSGGVCFSSDGHRLVTTGAEGLKIFDATPLPESR